MTLMKSILKNPLLLSLSGGVLLWAGWPSSPLFPLLFVGMAFLLISLENLIESGAKNTKVFFTLYAGLLTWNVLATWWIYHATLGGMLMAVIANSALMTIPFFAMKLTHKVGVIKLKYPVFIFAWLSYEYLHHNWSLSWPWLTLGNGLAKFPTIIQWYEYTGTAGGSLWLLLLATGTVAIYKCACTKTYVLLGATFITPIIGSFIIYSLYNVSYTIEPRTVEVAVLQPNFNTHTEKWSDGENFIPYDEQVIRMIDSSKKYISQETEFLVWPETAIPGSNRESYFHQNESHDRLKAFLKNYPNLTLITGFDSYEICPDQENPTEFASFSSYVGYYESYNAALMMTKDTMAIYHKSKFVPGAEQVPFPWLIKPIEVILGGVGFGHFIGQKEQVPFTNSKGIKVAPSICYESIFGEHMSKFNNNGAQFIFIITNDDWWHDTEGHRHHYEFARLRAIENRMCIARSGNTGFSGFFNEKGEDFQKTGYRTNACIKMKLPLPTNTQTFYVRFGDYIGKTAALLFVLLLVSLIVKRYTPKN
jgi:apolipoprotein N-acyltransferase